MYQPLKRTAAAYETKSAKEERRAERRKKRAARSKVLAELKEELSEAPTVIRSRTSASAAVDKREVRTPLRAAMRQLVQVPVDGALTCVCVVGGCLVACVICAGGATQVRGRKHGAACTQQEGTQASPPATARGVAFAHPCRPGGCVHCRRAWLCLHPLTRGPWVSCECSDFGDLEELLADEEAAGAGRGGLKGALSKRRAVQQAVNQAEQRHRTAVNRAMAVSGDQDVMKRERHTKRTFADDAEAEKHFGRGGPDRDGAGGAELSEDEAYTSAVKQRARKRARKQEAHEEVLYVAAWLWLCVCVILVW